MKKTGRAEMLARFTAPMPSVQERMAAGKAQREKVPHNRHAEFRRYPNRPDPVSIIHQMGSNVPRTVSLYVKQEMLQAHWNGRFLAAQLTEAARPGRDAHCYFFGRLVSHPIDSDRFVVDVDTLDQLAFTVRSVKQR